MRTLRGWRNTVVLGLVATAFAILAPAAHAGAIIVTKPVKWWDTLGMPLASLPSDTTYMTDEADTTRTVAITTEDWDWQSIAAYSGGVATSSTAARVWFVATGADNLVSDSLYFTVESGAVSGGKGVAASVVDTTFSFNAMGLGAQTGNGTIFATPYSSTQGARIWVGNLLVDPDGGTRTENIWMVPKFRLRVFGDVTGTTPKLSGLRCFITYPQRQEASQSQ